MTLDMTDYREVYAWAYDSLDEAVFPVDDLSDNLFNSQIVEVFVKPDEGNRKHITLDLADTALLNCIGKRGKAPGRIIFHRVPVTEHNDWFLPTQASSRTIDHTIVDVIEGVEYADGEFVFWFAESNQSLALQASSMSVYVYDDDEDEDA